LNGEDAPLDRRFAGEAGFSGFFGDQPGIDDVRDDEIEDCQPVTGPGRIGLGLRIPPNSIVYRISTGSAVEITLPDRQIPPDIHYENSASQIQRNSP